MGKFRVINIQESRELVDYLEYKTVVLTIPNLENYNITNESFLNFQSGIFYELNNLFWDFYNYPLYIRIKKDDNSITYTARITNHYMLKNILKLEEIVNSIFLNFPFKFIKKRRISTDEFIVNKLQKIDINNIEVEY